MLKDFDIRLALIQKIAKENSGHEYRIINELAVCDGEARVDIAVANGRLYGYEIKSDKDTLDRLPGQIRAYNRTFDKIIIVVGKKYETKIIEKVPEWWGINIAYLNKRNEVSFKNIRIARSNPEIEARALVDLLWREEIVSLLREKGVKGISGKNRRILRDIVVKTMPLYEIKTFVRETLKFREDWRVDL